MVTGISSLLGEPEYKAKADVVYENIRKGIMDGAFRPGDKLITDQIAAALRVSRMPVREAIKRLQAEGLVDVIPHKEVTVASITREQIRDVFAVRAVLEGLAARDAALRAQEDQIRRLRILLTEMEQLVYAEDTPGQLEKNRDFHEAIYDISGNQLLRSTAASLFDSIERYRHRLLSLPKGSQDVLDQHRQLIDAIASHDLERAEMLAREHIEITGRLMVSYIDEG